MRLVRKGAADRKEVQRRGLGGTGREEEAVVERSVEERKSSETFCLTELGLPCPD